VWDPVVGHWGWEQTFRVHPGSAGLEDNSIQVPRWAAGNARFVNKSYYFLQRQSSPNIGLPLAEELTYYPTICEPADNCTLYQRFHLGYIWTSVFSANAEFCPDLNFDYAATGADIGLVIDWFGASDGSYGVYEEWPRALYDANGSGNISGGDIAIVVSGFGAICHP
jgi:hypothetical protein